MWLLAGQPSHAQIGSNRFAGITAPGSTVYPNPHKPAAGTPINRAHPLSAGLVSVLPLYESAGTNFYDAATQQTYRCRALAGSPTNAQPPAWFTPPVTPDYPWGGPAIHNNGATAQSIQSTAQELDFVNNVTTGYSYAVLLRPLDTNTFGRIMDGTGPAVITAYLNIGSKPGKVSTTWRNAAGTAINPTSPFTTNQWILTLFTVRQGLGVMYINGAQAASDPSVDLARSWTGQTGQVVYNATGNGSMMCHADFSSWWVWNNRVLTAQEAAQMYTNPWAMFESGAQKGFIKGTQVTLGETAVAGSVCFYSHAAAGNVRLGIYDNASPRNLLWQSGSISNTAANAWLAAPVSAGTPPSLTLTTGVYWLAWQADTLVDVPSYVPGANGDGFVLGQPFGPFPTNAAGQQTSSERWSLYLTYLTPVDAWRWEHFGSGATNEALAGDAADPDSDGMNNRMEFLADTDPLSSNSTLRITGMQALPDGVRIGWQGGSQAWQYVECRQSLGTAGQWSALFTNRPVTAAVTNIVTAFTNPVQFFRIKADRM